MNRYHVTLYFNTAQDAMDSGYCDAVMVDDDVPELGYMSVISFCANGYEVEEESDE